LEDIPKNGTLCGAGPNVIKAFLNGKLLAKATRDLKWRIRPLLLSVEITLSASERPALVLDFVQEYA
jgi:hypothetical protein